MKKKILSILLAAMMVVPLLQIGAIPAFAKMSYSLTCQNIDVGSIKSVKLDANEQTPTGETLYFDCGSAPSSAYNLRVTAKEGYKFSPLPAGWQYDLGQTNVLLKTGVSVSTNGGDFISIPSATLISTPAETKTVADILATNSNFPVHIDDDDDDFWFNANDMIVYLDQKSLKLDDFKDPCILIDDINTATLTETGKNFSYSNNGVTTVFIIDENDKLIGIEISGYTEEGFEEFNGTYYPGVIVDEIFYTVTAYGDVKTAKVSTNGQYEGTSLVIPKTITYNDIEFDVTELEEAAFCWVTSIKEVELPGNVSIIGDDAFEQCKGLTTFKILATKAPTLATNVFNQCSNLEKIYVPAASVDAYKAADGWSAYKDKIEAIPAPAETKTVAQILATNPDFPVLVTDIPENAWLNENGAKLYFYQTKICFDATHLEVGAFVIMTDSVVSASGNNYIYVSDGSITTGTTITFCMDSNGKLVSIECTGYSESALNGTYKAPTHTVEVSNFGYYLQPDAPLVDIGFKVKSNIGNTNLVYEVAAYSKTTGEAYFTVGDISTDNGATFTEVVKKAYNNADSTQDVHLVWYFTRNNPGLEWSDDIVIEVMGRVEGDPLSITLGEVKSHDPWDGKIDVGYTLAGLEADANYKVAFDVTADGQTKSFTSEAAKLTNGTKTTVINTTTLFGKEIFDPKAKVAVRLIKMDTAEPSGEIKIGRSGPTEFVLGVEAPAHTHGEGDEAITFEKEIKTFADLQNLFANGGSGYLAADITATEGLIVAANVDLCLNDKVLNLAGKGNITVNKGVIFNLYDCGTTVRYYDKDTTTCLWILNTAKTSGDDSTTGGVITGGIENVGGMLVQGTFTMKGGTITGNAANANGGGVCIQGGSFIMSSGSIAGNTAKGNSGGVYVYSGSFTMTGGSINGNNASGNGKNTGYGGGVYVNSGTATITGGTITGNTAKESGGGVYVKNGTLILGGTTKITGNTAGSTTQTANNLYLCTGKTITLGTGNGEGGNGVAVPTTGFSVGVTTQTAPTADAPVKFTANGTADDAKWFTSDSADYCVNFVDADTDYLELKVAHVHNFTGDYIEYDTTNHKWAKKCECGEFDTANALTGVDAPTANTGLVYDNSEKTGVAEATGYTVTDGKKINAGDYTATATPAIGYIWSDGTTAVKEIKWSIAKATPYIQTKPAPTDITYGQKLNDSTLSGWYAQISATNNAEVGGLFEWKLGNTIPAVSDSEITEYEVTFTPTDTDNYNDATCKVTLTVNKAPVAAPTDAGSKVYTGGTLTADMDCTGKPYTVTTNAGGMAVGSYNVVLTLSDPANYKWSDSDEATKTLTFTITKADNVWATEPKIDGVTYGTAISPVGTAKFGDVTVTYFGTGDTVYNSATAPTNAGTYKATFSVAATDDYGALTKDVAFTIAKKSIEGATVVYDESKTYNGEEQTFGVTSVTIDGLTATFDLSGNKATDYKDGGYTLTITGNGNYTGTVTKSFAIAKKAATITVDAGTKVYGENDPALTATVSGTVGSDALNYTVKRATGENVSEYALSIELGENPNYEIDKVETAKFTITKKAVEKPVADTTSFVYNGNDQTYTIAANDLYTVSGNVQKNAGTYSVTVALTDKANYKWADGDSDDLTYMFTINESQISGGNVGEGDTKPVVQIETENGFDPDIELEVEIVVKADAVIAEDHKAIVDYKELAEKKEVVAGVYDVRLLLNGVEIQPESLGAGTIVTVRMLIPEDLIGKEFRLVHVHASDDVQTIVQGEEAAVGTYIIDDDGYLVTKIDRFSEFVFLRQQNRSLWWLWILIAIVVIGGAGTAYYYVRKKKKNQ